MQYAKWECETRIGPDVEEQFEWKDNWQQSCCSREESLIWGQDEEDINLHRNSYFWAQHQRESKWRITDKRKLFSTKRHQWKLRDAQHLPFTHEHPGLPSMPAKPTIVQAIRQAPARGWAEMATANSKGQNLQTEKSAWLPRKDKEDIKQRDADAGDENQVVKDSWDYI